MTHLRERWEGVCLSGNYTLEQWLGGDDGAAFFQTSLAPDGRRAVVKLVPEAAADSAGPLDLWQRIYQLRHPNLVELLDCGQADLDGEIVFYALFESPDDTLASAIGRAPLNQEEAREVLGSVIDALRYLHAQGLAAGALDPDHIVAIGERVKLSTGALLESETSSACREDVRLLGELWQRALMSASPKSAEIASHAADPNAETRWTLAEISSALAEDFQEAPVPAVPALTPAPLVESPVAAPAISAPLISEAQVSEPKVSEGQASEPQASEPQQEVRKATPRGETSPRRRPVPAASFRIPNWIIGAAAGLVFFLFALHWMPPATDVTQAKATSVSHPVNTAATPARGAAPPELVRETARPEPVRETARPEPKTETTPKSSLVASEEKIWRVIAFTYRTREAAAKKAEQLNEFHAGIDAAVFLPKDAGHYYLVSLGGRMTREDAERLQRSARGRGLPRDLYVQNYTR